MSVLEAIELKHGYRGGLELEVPKLTLARGGVLGLLGPSGSGKSTLVGILNLTERPHKGWVLVDGKPARGSALRIRRRMATCMQRPPLWRGTVMDNVEYGLKLRGTRRRKRRVKAEEMLSLVGLTGSETRDALTLSGGEAQRVGLARALAIEPEILFLDEPLSAVDEASKETLAVALRRFCLRTECATLWVTHDRSEALGACDDIAIMIDGEIVQSGPGTEVFVNPVDERAARVVGTGNIIEAKVVSAMEGLITVEAGPIQMDVVGVMPEGASVFVLLRPEDLSIWTRAPVGSGPRNRFKARITDIAVLGALARVHLDIGVPVTALITRPTMQEMGLQTGAEVWCGFKSVAARVSRRG